MNAHPQPPKWIQRFFRWYCNLSHQEHLEGDLFELFERRVQQKGLRKARLLYFRDVLDLIRPFTLRRKTPQYYTSFNSIDMFLHYLKTAIRSLRRNYSYTLINILGLSLGLLIALVIFIKVGHDLSFDRGVPDVERIYRIVTTNSNGRNSSGIPGPIPEKLAAETADIEKITIINRNFKEYIIGIPQADGQVHRMKELAATEVWPEYFEVFQHEWIEGDPNTALTNPRSAVITEDRALQYFGTMDVIGKTLETEDDSAGLIITGLIKNPPLSTNFPFHLLVSMADEKIPWWMVDQWSSFAGQFQAYVKLTPNADPKAVDKQIAAWLDINRPADVGDYTMHLQPVRSMHLNPEYGSFSKPAVDKTTLWALALIAVFLLISGTINFVNIHTARMIQRAREVGVRKILGSTNGDIFRAVMTETTLVILISFILAMAFTPLVFLHGEFLIGDPLSLSLITELNLWLYLFAFGILAIVLAGIYPAMLMARTKVVNALKNKVDRHYGKGINLRKGLLIVQFSISQILIICTLIAMQQMDFFRSSPLGFNYSALLEVEMPAEDSQQLKRIKSRLEQQAGITRVCFSNTGASSDNYWKFNYSLFPEDSASKVDGMAQVKMVDDSYISTYGIEILAGKNFPRWDTLPYAMINESLLSEINIERPEDALGLPLNCGNNQLEIIAVVRDYNTQSLHHLIEPVIIMPSLENAYLAGIKVEGKQLTETVNSIQDIWEEEFPEEFFEYAFLDESIEAFYEQEKRATILFQIAAGLAVFIGILGLLGLVAMSIARRTKEIGIRKVLGAGISQILSIFTREFVLVVFMGFVIATPIAWYAMQHWLAEFAHSIDIKWYTFGLTFLLSFFIMIAVVSLKSWRAANMNPVDAIRDE